MSENFNREVFKSCKNCGKSFKAVENEVICPTCSGNV